MGKTVEKIDPNVIKTILKSSRKFKEMYPVLLDANNELIDGRHRKEVDPSWSTRKLREIKTTRDRLEARLVANHARKGQHKATWVPTLSELGKILQREGIEKIGMKISEETGIPYRTLMRYLPEEFKDKDQVKRAKHPRLPTDSQKRTVNASVSVPVQNYQKTKHVEEEIKEYKSYRDKPRPRIEIKEFRNTRWVAIMIEEEFYEKLKSSCEKKSLDLQEAVTLALMKLLSDLRRAKDA